MNFLAPAGTPIKIRHLFKWIAGFPYNESDLITFAKKLESAFNIKHCMFISSGRTALYLILKNLYELKGDPLCNEVIIPSYTCFSVPGSIIKAGLKVRICDIDPNTLNYKLDDLKRFDFNKVLGIVSSNLYGIPNDLPVLEKIAQKNGIFLIDDAAQSMGAIVDGKASGTYGDIGLFSLDKGKNITSIQGGIIITNSDNIAQSIQNTLSPIVANSTKNTLLDCIKIIIYSFLLPPDRYWVVTKAPFLKLGITPYTTDYPVHQYSPTLGSLASLLFDELPDITTNRVKNANLLIYAIKHIRGIQLIRHSTNISPVYIRLPILVNSKSSRDKLVTVLNNNGIGATASYPSSVCDIKEITDVLNPDDMYMPGGRAVADNIITLPTHPYMTNYHVTRITNILRSFTY